MKNIILSVLLSLALPALANDTDPDKELARAVVLMETCQNDIVMCDLMLQTNLDNIRFFVGVNDDKEALAGFFGISHLGCLNDLTVAEVRVQVQTMYKGLDYAKLGASQMIFNSILGAVGERCKGQGI